MPLLFIRAKNAEFHASDDGAEYGSPEAALESGIQSAMELIAEDIARGERNAAIEVCIEREDGTCVLRSVVAVSVSPLIVAEKAAVTV